MPPHLIPHLEMPSHKHAYPSQTILMSGGGSRVCTWACLSGVEGQNRCTPELTARVGIFIIPPRSSTSPTQLTFPSQMVVTHLKYFNTPTQPPFIVAARTPEEREQAPRAAAAHFNLALVFLPHIPLMANKKLSSHLQQDTVPTPLEEPHMGPWRNHTWTATRYVGVYVEVSHVFGVYHSIPRRVTSSITSDHAAH